MQQRGEKELEKGEKGKDLMRANTFRGPLEGMGPENRDF
jgi:hypothetical protein